MIGTPSLNKDSFIFKIKEIFNIQVNEKNFKLTISHNENIIFFEIEDNNIFPKKIYSLYQSLKELINIDKYFRQFDNLDEVFNAFKTLISIKNLIILNNDNIMQIKIINLNKEIFINIPYKEKDIKSEIDSLISYIISLNKKVEKLENEIISNKKEFQNEINNLKNQIIINKNELVQNINELKVNIDNLKIENKKKNKKIKFFEGSNIIKENENDIILNWFDKEPIDAKLLLNSKNDDDSFDTFFKKCGNNSPLIIFIKTNENIRFGGFCSVNWPKEKWARDEKSFIFSLDKNEIYKVNKPDNAIGKLGNIISFGSDEQGSWDLLLRNNYLKNGGETWKHIYQLPEYNLINNGKNKFFISNLEIYQLFF